MDKRLPMRQSSIPISLREGASRMAVLSALLDRFDFAGAEKEARRLGLEQEGSILEALAQIRRCDYEAAGWTLSLASKASGSLTDEVHALAAYAALLREGEKTLAECERLEDLEGVRALAADLLFLAESYFMRADYPEALTALYRLHEVLVRVRFETVTKLPGGRLGEIRTDPARSFEWTAELSQLLENGPGQLHFQLHPGTETMRYALLRLEPESVFSLWLDNIYGRTAGAGSGVLILRNQSRVGHGFAAVTEQAIRQNGWPDGWPELVRVTALVAQTVMGGQVEAPYRTILAAIAEGLLGYRMFHNLVFED